jgi:hypothetical protein
LALRRHVVQAFEEFAPTLAVLIRVSLFLRVGPGAQFVSALDHPEAGPLIALGGKDELDEDRVADQRNEKRVGGSTVSTTTGPP